MQAGSPTTDERQPRRAVRAMVLTGAMVAMLAAPVAAFAKGGGTSVTPWISLASVNGGSAVAAQPKLGSDVRFNAGYATSTKNPWVSLSCYQNDVLVYGEGNSPTADFVLGGGASTWLTTGGAATCRAELGDLYWKGGHEYYTYLAHTDFTAGG